MILNHPHLVLHQILNAIAHSPPSPHGRGARG
jgi:hypothetical protein